MTRIALLVLGFIAVLPSPSTAQARSAKRPKAAAAVVPSAATVDTAASLPRDPAVTVGRLPNGLRYYIRVNRKPEKRAELRLVVDAGSVLEDADQRGLAHFVEHMAFNGTTHFEKQELVNYLESIGMRFGPDVNAYTSFDETVYMLQIPTDTARIVRTAFQILEDWARGVTFDPKEIEKERGVVIEEWRLGRGAQARISDKQFPVLFRESRYAERLPIGTKESLDRFTPEAVRRFYRDWYRPDLMAVIAVGDFDRAVIERRIREHFGRIPPARAPRARTLHPVPDHDSTLVTIASDRELTLSSVGIAYKHPTRDQRSVGSYRQAILAQLYNGMLNRRFSEIVQTQADPPFLGAGSSRGGFVRTKDVYSLGAAVKENGVERGLEALLTEAERVDKFGFTASELERQKQDALRGMERAFAEREKTESDDYASEYVRAFLESEPFPGIAYEYALYQRFLPGVTLEEINRLGREWITDRNRVILASVPEKEGVKVPAERELLAVFDRVKRATVAAYVDSVTAAPLIATPPAPGRVVAERTIPEVGVTEWRLSNGARVVLKPTEFKADQVLFAGWSWGGTSLVPDSLFLSADYADAIAGFSGAGPFSAVNLRKALAGKAASVGPSISELEESIGGQASPKDLETMFQLVWLYFTAPRTDSVAFAALRSQFAGMLANRSASPEAAYFDTLGVTLAQHHPRARPVTVGRLDEIQLGRAMAFYRDRFADAGDFNFYLVGNFRLEEIRPLVERYLASLPSTGRKESWRDVGIRPPAGVVERVVKRGVEPKARTQLTFTGPFEWTRENRYALQSMLDVLRIKLREQLREEQGGTYGVGVGGGPQLYPAARYTITVSFGSSPERLEELTKLVFAQIDTLKAIGASPADLAKVKETQLRERETNLERNEYWIGQLASYDRFGLDYRDILTYERMVQGLTAAAIRDAARRYLDATRYVRISLYPETFEPARR